MSRKIRKIYGQFCIGIVLLLTGSLFLADHWFQLKIITKYWPMLIVVMGLLFLITMIITGKKGAGLAIPGIVITTLGILLFIQNVFHLWITWTYAWTVLVIALGIGILVMNLYLRRKGLRRGAGIVIVIGLVQFFVFGFLFEGILNLSGFGFKNEVFLGIGLVLFGLLIIFSRLLFPRSKQDSPETKPVVIDTESMEVPQQPEKVEES
jgi:peptidoglycan/LPS O-acetylase OafA/YrhL